MQILQLKLNDRLSEEDWASILALESHLEDIKAANGERWQEVEVLSKGVRSFALVEDHFTEPFVQEMFARVGRPGRLLCPDAEPR